MARATSGLGQFRGKVGAVVFRVSQGQQIASAYQPAVRNPKSNLQTAQRNKMYLASQLSKLVPREDIVGLAPRGTTRDRRSMFIKNILDNTTSTLVDGVFTSGISHYGISFSNGNYYSGLSTAVGNDNALSLVFNKAVVSEEQFNRTAVKVIQVDIVNNYISAYKSSWINLGSYGASGDNVTIPINIAVQGGTTSYIFIVPVEVAENVRYSEERKTLVQVDPTSQEIVILGEYNVNSAVLNWFKTMTVAPFTDGDIEIVPPISGGDSVVNPDGPNFPNLG